MLITVIKRIWNLSLGDYELQEQKVLVIIPEHTELILQPFMLIVDKFPDDTNPEIPGAN